MNFAVFRDRLVAIGYSDDTAYAKIAHDIVLFMRNLSRPVNAWLDVPPEEAAASITAFISSLE